MNLYTFIELLKTARMLSFNMARNMIIVDNVVYDITDGIIESSYEDFLVKSTHDLKILNMVLSGGSDKKSKKPMTHRLSMKFVDVNNVNKGLTLEYNDSVMFTKNELLTENYIHMPASVYGKLKMSDNGFISGDTFIRTKCGEMLEMEQYYDKYKVFARPKKESVP